MGNEQELGVAAGSGLPTVVDPANNGMKEVYPHGALEEGGELGGSGGGGGGGGSWQGGGSGAGFRPGSSETFVGRRGARRTGQKAESCLDQGGKKGRGAGWTRFR